MHAHGSRLSAATRELERILTIGYGDVVPTTVFGRIDAVLPGVIGLVFAGLIVAAAVRGVQEASRQARNRA